jgi:hypothetical protein
VTGLACSLAHRQSQAKIELLRNVGNEQKVLPPIRLCDSLTHIAISAKRRRGVYLLCTNRRSITQRGRGASDWKTPTDLGCRGRIHCWAAPHSRFQESKHYRSHRGVDPAKIRVLSQGAGVGSWTCIWCGVSVGGWASAHHHSLPLSTALHPPVLRIYGPIIRTFR